jgi:hypothetical protein
LILFFHAARSKEDRTEEGQEVKFFTRDRHVALVFSTPLLPAPERCEPVRLRLWLIWQQKDSVINLYFSTVSGDHSIG